MEDDVNSCKFEVQMKHIFDITNSKDGGIRFKYNELYVLVSKLELIYFKFQSCSYMHVTSAIYLNTVMLYYYIPSGYGIIKNM